jgi:hypothetical protein
LKEAKYGSQKMGAERNHGVAFLRRSRTLVFPSHPIIKHFVMGVILSSLLFKYIHTLIGRESGHVSLLS